MRASLACALLALAASGLIVAAFPNKQTDVNHRLKRQDEEAVEDVAEEVAAEEVPEESPVEEVPEEAPAEDVPEEEEVPEEVPAEEVPVEEVPEEVPAEETPAEEVPAEEVPAEEVPAEEVPADEVPEEEVPAEEVPVDEVPPEEVPVEAEAVAGEDVPAEDPSSEDPPSEDPPAEEVPAEEEPVPEEEAAPVEESPVEEGETSSEAEAPVDGTPEAEAPVDETPPEAEAESEEEAEEPAPAAEEDGQVDAPPEEEAAPEAPAGAESDVDGGGAEESAPPVDEDVIEAVHVTPLEETVEAAPPPACTSPTGCCPGTDLPAHGDEAEGCCSSSLYGCCPDNVRPAGVNGSESEACGCATSRFGCCPDGKTTALGSDPATSGCGCRHMPHGCCPDQYTAATGPGQEGCPCHTFEHGCCADGVTRAAGPNLAGCKLACLETEFGCCQDEYTAAEGPYFLGCGCAGSKFGCCPDGASEAHGPGTEAADDEAAASEDGAASAATSSSASTSPAKDFLGCGEMPGEACHLPKDVGSCKDNFTVAWFFDRDYGGCSRFWFSGCDGNSNRFETAEACEKICVSPGGSGRCYLPKVTGPCRGSYAKWHFDSATSKCVQFKYGGCLGNDNRFDTKNKCQEACLGEVGTGAAPAVAAAASASAESSSDVPDSIDVCSQPLEPGPCRGSYPRFYYDQDLGECQQFLYSGCHGNRNRFSSAAECANVCKHKARLATAKRTCTLKRAAGQACTGENATTEVQPAWFFDNEEKRCRTFYYLGCGGNDNRFETREECEQACPNSFPPELESASKIIVLEENQEALFKITVEANPPPVVVWQFNGRPIFPKEADSADAERFSQLADFSLRISPAKMNDSGVYTVTADNGLGNVARKQVTLKVQPSRMPIQVSIPKAKTTFKFGEEVTLPCLVSGYPLPVVRWYKNNTPLPKSDRLFVKDDDTNTLVIAKATPIDGGVYTCRATNKHESVTDVAEIRVEKGEVPKACIDKPAFARCDLIVRAGLCDNTYYADFCCKSCTLKAQKAVEDNNKAEPAANARRR